MSKSTDETIAKARKLLEKKGSRIDEGSKRAIEEGLARAQSLDAEYHRYKDAVKEKRLDIEDNARVVSRAIRTAKKGLEAVDRLEKVSKTTAAAARRATAARGPAKAGKSPTPPEASSK
jgi:hypothetical protein